MLGVGDSDDDMFDQGGFVDNDEPDDDVRSALSSAHSAPRSHVGSAARRAEQAISELEQIKRLLYSQGTGSPLPTIVSSNRWSRWDTSYNDCLKPTRCLVLNVPISAWKAGATDISHVQTAHSKQQHAQTQAAFALLSLFTAGTARGIYTGTHPLVALMQEAGEDSEDIAKKIKELGTLSHYPFYPPPIPGEDPQSEREIGRQFGWVLELVVDEARKPIAVRFWKIIDDPSHSDSALWSSVMSSNNADDRESKANRMASNKRNAARRSMSTNMRSFVDGDNLEESAEFMHATIRDLHTLSTTCDASFKPFLSPPSPQTVF